LLRTDYERLTLERTRLVSDCGPRRFPDLLEENIALLLIIPAILAKWVSYTVLDRADNTVSACF
jgi:hypothetical protein